MLLLCCERFVDFIEKANLPSSSNFGVIFDIDCGGGMYVGEAGVSVCVCACVRACVSVFDLILVMGSVNAIYEDGWL